eukprot:scaffold30403_cov65-Phaeocystis_antarctica.AAC.3
MPLIAGGKQSITAPLCLLIILIQSFQSSELPPDYLDGHTHCGGGVARGRPRAHARSPCSRLQL